LPGHAPWFDLGVTATPAGAVRCGLAVLLAGGVGACASSDTDAPAAKASSATIGAQLPVPARSTSPEQVASVYLRAAKAQDCRLTAALTLPHTWSWCRDPRLLDYRSVGSANFVPASEAGRDEKCVGFEMDTHGSSDGSMPIGWQPWRLCLVSTSAGWRLYDQGQG
jgi:hypothetical protein